MKELKLFLLSLVGIGPGTCQAFPGLEFGQYCNSDALPGSKYCAFHGGKAASAAIRRISRPLTDEEMRAVELSIY